MITDRYSETRSRSVPRAGRDGHRIWGGRRRLLLAGLVLWANASPGVIVGENNMVWVKDYNGPDAGIVSRLEGATGLRWSVNGQRNNCGTGTLISPDLFLTVYREHCNYRPGYTVAFEYEYDYDGNLRPIDEYEIVEWVDKGEAYGNGIDYSIVRLEGKPGLKHGFVRPAMYEPPVGEKAILIHHSEAKPKRLSIGSFVPEVKFPNTRLAHNADSLKGASGAGVLDKHGRLVSLNTAADNGVNKGVSMKTILEVSPAAGEILAYAAPCDGRTPEGNTDWVDYTGSGVYVDIDTSHCGFDATPLYFTSLGGSSSQWLSRGTTSIYRAGRNRFRVYVKYPWGIDPGKANNLGWHVNWQAIPRGYRESSLCTGRTHPGDWGDSYLDDTVYVNINTAQCGFSHTPQYLTSLQGNTRHWDTRGVTAIHYQTPSSLQVHVTRPGITAAAAQQYGWRVNWRAETNRRDDNTAVADACVGTESSGWRQYNSRSLYINVDTGDCELSPANRAPLAFFSLNATDHSNIDLDGLTTVYSPRPGGFRVYVRAPHSITPSDAVNHGWEVQWHLRD